MVREAVLQSDLVTVPEAFALALQHHQAGRLAEAGAIYRQILATHSRHADALHLLGVIAHQVGRNDEAVVLIRQAIAIAPGVSDYHDNLGVALQTLGQFDEAIASYRRACQIDPDSARVHCGLGNALWTVGQIDEAIVEARKAIQCAPDCVEAHNNLGNALKDQGRLEEATAAYLQALGFNPEFAEIHNNLGNALKDQGHPDEAIAAYRRTIQLKPDSADAHSNLLLDLHYLPGFEPEELFREHRRWEEIQSLPLAKFIGRHGNDRNPERRLRIGYVSPDFREHPVAFFLESLLAAHDRGQVEVFCYADVLREDTVTKRFHQHTAQWRKIAGMKDEQVADLIRTDGIDILVDLAGHTARNRLLVFARKPAPIQVTYLGYCDTTGMNTMDYRLTDTHADPPGTTEHLHTEQLVRLPDCAWCFRPSDHSPPVGSPPTARSGHITFGCFNARPKITAEMLDLWSNLLLEAPGSRLLLKNPGFGDPSVQLRTRELLAKAGVAHERVELLGRVPTVAEHLAQYGRVDIALDTFPYNGTTTTCDALWMGVPVVTLAGRTHAARVGVSLLSNVGLPELIAANAGDYIRIAVHLAADTTRLAELRAMLRERMASSPLMDAPRFARNVEHAYREMWRAWCMKQCSNPPS